MAAASVFVLRMSSGCFLPLWETLQDQYMGHPGSFQITASALGPGACEILCAPFKSGVSIS